MAPSPPSVYTLINSFRDGRRFNGSNYGPYCQEFEMTFGADTTLWSHISGTAERPKPAGTTATAEEQAAMTKWDQEDRYALTAIYKTIDSDAVLAAHVKPSMTAAKVWTSMESEYRKDSRSTRLELKRRLHNPTHDPAVPISTYIQDIVSASEHLAILGHPVPAVDVTDSIILHLDSSWHVIKTLLTSQAGEPSVQDLKSSLLEYEATFGRVAGEQALAARSGGKHGKGKRADRHRDRSAGSDSDDESGFDWLNPRGRKHVCNRCGRPKHKAQFCMARMPQEVKDKIMQSAHNVHSIASDDSDSDDSIITQPRAGKSFAGYGRYYSSGSSSGSSSSLVDIPSHILRDPGNASVIRDFDKREKHRDGRDRQAERGGDRAHHVEVGREARKLLKRLQV